METWRQVVGFESSYSVSDMGNVRRISPRNLLHRRLSQSQIEKVFYLRSKGSSQRAIADSVGITQAAIGRILNGTAYQEQDPYLLRPALRRDGYLFVTLCVDGRTKHCTIHRAVAEAFIGPCPNTCQVNHKDGNKTNNALINLEYLSPSENTRHAMDVLGKGKKITRAIAEEIRRLRADGVTQKEVASKFGVSVALISKIIQGTAWGNSK